MPFIGASMASAVYANLGADTRFSRLCLRFE